MDAVQAAGRGVVSLRVQGRRLLGTVVRYGAPGQGGMEQFAPGAFVGGLDDVLLNVQHRRDRPLARYPGSMTLTDGAEALTMEAAMPETRDGDDALTLVKARVLVGLSVGFVALSERWERDVRIIERATLDHVAIVDRPSYPDSRVDARAGVRFWQLPGGYQGTGAAPNSAHRRSSRVRRWL